MAAFQDRTNIFKALIAKAKEDMKQEELSKWINVKTVEE